MEPRHLHPALHRGARWLFPRVGPRECRGNARGGCLPLCEYVFWNSGGVYPGEGVLGRVAALFSVFLRNRPTASHSGRPVCTPAGRGRGSPFSTASPTTTPLPGVGGGISWSLSLAQMQFGGLLGAAPPLIKPVDISLGTWGRAHAKCHNQEALRPPPGCPGVASEWNLLGLRTCTG